jgi:hypothetical protein
LFPWRIEKITAYMCIEVGPIEFCRIFTANQSRLREPHAIFLNHAGTDHDGAECGNHDNEQGRSMREPYLPLSIYDLSSFG